VPISAELERLLKQLRAGARDRKWVYPRIIDWQRGESARVLRAFCVGIGITSVKFHTLRACFATQLLCDNIAPILVMKICGWKDLKTLQTYTRLAGIEIEGATDTLKVLPSDEVMGRVVELFGAGNSPS
jgi:integrase